MFTHVHHFITRVKVISGIALSCMPSIMLCAGPTTLSVITTIEKDVERLYQLPAHAALPHSLEKSIKETICQAEQIIGPNDLQWLLEELSKTYNAPSTDIRSIIAHAIFDLGNDSTHRTYFALKLSLMATALRLHKTYGALALRNNLFQGSIIDEIQLRLLTTSEKLHLAAQPNKQANWEPKTKITTFAALLGLLVITAHFGLKMGQLNNGSPKLSEQLTEAQSEVAGLTKTAALHAEQYQTAHAGLQESIAQGLSRAEQLEGAHAAFQQELQAHNEQLQGHYERQSALIEEVQTLNPALQKAQETLQAVTTELSELRAEREALRAMIEAQGVTTSALAFKVETLNSQTEARAAVPQINTDAHQLQMVRHQYFVVLTAIEKVCKELHEAQPAVPDELKKTTNIALLQAHLKHYEDFLLKQEMKKAAKTKAIQEYRVNTLGAVAQGVSAVAGVLAPAAMSVASIAATAYATHTALSTPPRTPELLLEQSEGLSFAHQRQHPRDNGQQPPRSSPPAAQSPPFIPPRYAPPPHRASPHAEDEISRSIIRDTMMRSITR